MTERHGVLKWSTINTVVFICALFPVFWILMLSLKDPATVSDGRLIPSKWSTSNYSDIFDQEVFTRALVNSIGIALIATVISVVLASMAAYAIARLNFPGKAPDARSRRWPSPCSRRSRSPARSTTCGAPWASTTRGPA